MLHPSTELKFINKEIGLGVFVTEFIPKGTILWAFDDLDILIPNKQVKSTPELIKSKIMKYGYRFNSKRYVLNWDITRYINHSCYPNSRSVGPYMDIAIRDIQQGEQLMCDYGILNYSDLNCLCGEANCRKIIKATDCINYYKQWDDEILEALKLLNNVTQPMYELAIKTEENRKIIESNPNFLFPSSKWFYLK